MLFMTLIIVAVVFIGLALMSAEQMHHINRSTVAMVCGVVAWVIYLLNGGDFVPLMHGDEYKEFLAGGASTTDSLKYFVADHISRCMLLLILSSVKPKPDIRFFRFPICPHSSLVFRYG